MNDSTSLVVEKAVEWARKYGVPIVLASTSGQTAKKILSHVENHELPVIVVNHEGKNIPREWRFDAAVEKELRERGHTVLPAKTGLIPPVLARWVTKTFGIVSFSARGVLLEELLGTGGRVCFKIARRAVETQFIRTGQAFVAVAGKISGADTALALKVLQSKPPKITLLEVIARRASDSL